MLSGEIARRLGQAGLPPDTIRIVARGAPDRVSVLGVTGHDAGARGGCQRLRGKGLSGGIVVARPPDGSPFLPDDQVIVGNVVLYGATGGSAFFNGRAGERFAVRKWCRRCR